MQRSLMDQICADIKAAEDKLLERKKVLDKARSGLSKGRNRIAKAGLSLKLLRELATQVKAFPPEPEGPDLLKLAQGIQRSLESLQAQFDQAFRAELEENARPLRMSVGRAEGQLTLGPFLLVLNRTKEIASLEYAKSVVADKLPLKADKLVSTAATLAEAFEPPSNPTSIAPQLEEAIRISLARQRKPTSGSELRGEILAVYREMVFLKQGGKRYPTKSTFKDYSLARFVVEVRSLIESEENIAGDTTFRLETAVIENANNPKKSVFFPKRLTEGFGEGMWYQAVVMRRVG